MSGEQLKRCDVRSEIGVHGNPSLDGWANPEQIDPEGDDAQQEPLDPQPEQTGGGTGELQTLPVNEGVLAAPSFVEHKREGVADPESDNGDESAEECSAKVGAGAAIESETFSHNEFPQIIGARVDAHPIH